MVHSHQIIMVVHLTIRRFCLTCFRGKEQDTGGLSCKVRLPISIIVPHQQSGIRFSHFDAAIIYNKSVLDVA